ncbi:MAG: hypothetical protein HZB50_09220 [Chloroflexi bacterium]|nr:hypothetical protein [Chloroflexota bacterium]
MRLLNKIPFLLGWLAFYLSVLLVIRLLGLRNFSFLGDSFPRLTLNTNNFMLLAALYVIIGFFAFIFSISKVALPLYWVGKIQADEYTKIAFGSYSLMWLAYLIVYLIFCIPLAYNWLPIEMDRPIDMALQTLASFLVYRGVVHFWLDNAVLRNQKNNLPDQKKDEADQSG